MKKIAVVLAGCGAKDGSEITESVSLLIALAELGPRCETLIFAPDRPTHHVVNHKNGQEVPEESRNMLVEAARIARGRIEPLSALTPERADVLVFPGGFGTAKNLCNFALAGKDAQLMPDVEKVLTSFIEAKRWIGALCIAPVLLALAAKKLNLPHARITLGPAGTDAAQAVESWGADHVERPVNESCTDPMNRFVTAPAYMYADATPADIYASAKALVQGLVKAWGG